MAGEARKRVPVTYLPRLIDEVLREVLAEVPAVLVAGPRACGKTTSAAQVAASIMRLDRADEAAAVRADVDSALTVPAEEEPILIDEWQFVPEILGAVKRAVDHANHPARFLLTGSASADLGPAGWAMTGRVLKLSMWGLTERELAASTAAECFVDRLFSGGIGDIATPTDQPNLRGYVERSLRGMLPAVALSSSDRIRQRRLAAYLDQIVLRDVTDLGDRRDPRLLRRYLSAIAANTAGAVEHKTLYDAAGIDRRTATAYDTLLEGLFVTEQVPAWSSNRLNRLTRTSKRYLVDPSFVSPLVGVDARSILRSADLLGRIIDTFVLAQLRPELEACLPGVTICHLRQEGGYREVDLVLEAPDGRVVAVEVKAGSAPDRSDSKHLEWMRDKVGDQFVCGVVLHTGTRPFKLADRIHALPISTIWS
jgi:uncharacterized protein